MKKPSFKTPPIRKTPKETPQKQRRRRIGRAIVEAAPGIAEALAGPLAGAAVEAVKKAIFGEKQVSEEIVEKAVEKMSPTLALKLAEAEAEFYQNLWQAQGQAEEIAAADRANARQRQLEMDDKMPKILGASIVVGFFLVLAFMFLLPIPIGFETEFSILLGALATMTAAVVNFYFGSSAGSREKTWLFLDKRG
jgi:archaellum biogenesis protein FlaJ (TadC family)